MIAPDVPLDGPAECPSVADLLELAVRELGGDPRAGQAQMADAIGDCLGAGSGTVLVQAGTGTGKSLAYLVPAARHAMATDTPVVIATATLALQRQLVEKDLPVVSRALSPALGRDVTFAVLKGRSNYLCLDRLNRGSPDPEESALFDTPTTRAGTPGRAPGEVGDDDHDWRSRRPHRSRRWPGVVRAVGIGQGVPRGCQLRVRTGLLRRGREGPGARGRPDRDQPCTPGDPRPGRGTGPPRARGSGGRRGP